MENIIFCLDVDGTIIAKEGNFYSGAEWMCSQLNKMNWQVVLCSARPIKSLIFLADKLVGIEWVCGLGGAIISHKVAQHSVNSFPNWEICYHRDYIDESSLTSIFNWAICNNIMELWSYDLTKWYVTSQTNYVDRESFIIKMTPNLSSFNDIPKDKLLKLVFPNVPNELMQSLQDCAEKCGLSANYSTNKQVEIISSLTADKGVKKLRRLLFGEQETKVIALGDGANDFGMLAYSDIPLTFEDGHSRLQEIAQVILDKNREKAYHTLVHLLSEGFIS